MWSLKSVVLKKIFYSIVLLLARKSGMVAAEELELLMIAGVIGFLSAAVTDVITEMINLSNMGCKRVNLPLSP